MTSLRDNNKMKPSSGVRNLVRSKKNKPGHGGERKRGTEWRIQGIQSKSLVALVSYFVFYVLA